MDDYIKFKNISMLIIIMFIIVKIALPYEQSCTALCNKILLLAKKNNNINQFFEK